LNFWSLWGSRDVVALAQLRTKRAPASGNKRRVPLPRRHPCRWLCRVQWAVRGPLLPFHLEQNYRVADPPVIVLGLLLHGMLHAYHPQPRLGDLHLCLGRSNCNMLDVTTVRIDLSRGTAVPLTNILVEGVPRRHPLYGRGRGAPKPQGNVRTWLLYDPCSTPAPVRYLGGSRTLRLRGPLPFVSTTPRMATKCTRRGLL
jgi:hypothetical protein